jgi:large conductance mechanosensitive channel
MLKEFREFAVKGNMIDLAVGLILGTAFGAVVQSLVNDVIMPPIGLLAGRMDFSNLQVVLGQGDAGPVLLKYGMFVNTLVNFVIVAGALFFVVRAINRLKREPATSPAEPPQATDEVKLLQEIRDLMKARA